MTEKALDVLRTYPQDAVVADLYDVDSDFADAINSAFGREFEYPDHSHRTVGQAVKAAMQMEQESYREAENIAKAKGEWSLLDGLQKNTFDGQVMGITSHHVVQSLGRSAAIHHKDNLDRIPEKSEIAYISYDGRGHGAVKAERKTEIQR